MKLKIFILWILALSLPILTACGSSQTTQRPAPVSYMGNVNRTQSTTPAQPTNSVNYARTASGQGLVSVQENDTVYEISRRYGISMRELITRNDLRPPYILQIGDRLILPAPNSYTVQRGDSLWGIAQTFNSSTFQIARRNNLSQPYILQPGQSLILPNQTVRGSTPSNLPPITTPTTSIATRTAPSLISSPHQSPIIRRTRWLPPTTAARTPSSVPVTTANHPITTAAASNYPHPPRSPRTALGANNTPSTPQITNRPTRTTPPITTANNISSSSTFSSPRPTRSMRGLVPQRPPARNSSRFAWPVQGRVISDFGPKQGGLHNDGLNIAAARGTRVSAAENGIVAYAGNEISGFGNLVLIRHSDGWMTAYAHLDNIAVARGSTVRSGQAIGTVGSTGLVEQPQLHFEVRRGATAIDPNGYL